MIIGLSILAILLIVVFALPALRQPVSAKRPDEVQQGENLRLYQERVIDIDSMEFSDSEKAELRLELDRELLQTTEAAQGALLTDKPKQRRVFTLLMLIIVLGTTYALYQFWGASNELRTSELLGYSTNAELSELESQELIERLGKATDRAPENIEWPYFYGRMLQAEGKFNEAALVYKQLLSQLPAEHTADRAAIMTLMTQARFFATDQQASDSLYRDATSALALVPNQRQTLGLAGILAFELGYYEKAIEHWRVLWSQLPQGMEAMALENGIRRAATELEAQNKAVDLTWLETGNRQLPESQAQTAVSSNARIEVAVDVTSEVRQQASPSTIVFVLARAEQGPPMPLAVKRMTLSELPTTVILDDSMAMAAGVNLSSVKQVTVTARVSNSGQPMAQSGDWQAQLQGIPTEGSAPLSLMIDQQIQ
ncbi:MAG: c-type cytochrome biogenesis protein CcmI [Oleibacter sp.]|nr:c-type cytochrome biogenesis protein CcmI [Thalassolituus sp.]